MRNILRKLLPIAVAVLLIALTGLFWSVYGQTKNRQAVGNGKAPVTQQPLFTEYKGVKLGMAAQEVRAKLGDPVLKSEEMDYFIFPNGVTAQVAYDSAHQVRTISIDYAGGAGAPEARDVVGAELETRPDGSTYKVVRYPGLGFWVSYNRSAGPVITISITIAKIL